MVVNDSTKSKWRIPLFDVRFGPEEEEAVLRPIRAGWLTMGEEVQRLEEELCGLTGVKFALAVSSCTAALHLACAALNIGPGDEVICPTLTFVASANAPRSLGARIRFCDSAGPHDLGIDPTAAAALFAPRTRAIVAVHYAGFACRIDELSALADGRGLPIIEDCAHALFTTYRGKVLGRHGRIGCFSFFSNKNATCGEGGAVLTDDPELAQRMRLLRSHGMTTTTLDRHHGRAYSYDVASAGFNYRLDEVRAALLRVQLRRLPDSLARRRRLFHLYAERLTGTPVVLPFSTERHRRELENTAVHLVCVLLPEGTNRLAVMGRLKEMGIQTSIHYPPVHSFAAYRSEGQCLPRTEALAQRQLTLPLYPAMRDEDVDTVVAALLEALRGGD